ncbi:MAG: molybdopterin biosynthesis enzyme, partial [Thermaurantiacus sp.]
MMFGELPLAEAEGAVLAHAVLLAGRRVPKGSLVDAGLIEAARAEGLDRLWVARAGPEDVHEADAAARVGSALAGPGVEARPPVHGRVNLHAARAGLFRCDPAAIRAANLTGDAVAISTLPPFTPVVEGQMLATIKLIPFSVSSDVLAAATPPAPIEVHPWRTGLRVTLIATTWPGTTAKALARSRDVSAGRLA